MKPWTFLMVAWFCMVSSAVHVPGIVQGQHNEIYAKEENLEPETTPRDYAFNTTNNSNFTCVNEEDNFPSFLTPQQQKNGGIIICVLIIMYFFTLLTIICDKYFLPAIEHLCEVLHLSPDVAAATFMSIATSCPELFTNIIATFVTNSELGIGTIVGSSMFNSLGAAAIGSLAAISKIQLDWWPITRDVFVYMITVSLLAGIIWDGYIYWYEGIALFVAFLVYFVIMFQNPRISRFVKKLAAKFQSKNDVSGNPGNSYQVEKDELEIKHHNKETVESSEETENDIFKIPQGGIWTKFIFFYCWPIRVILLYTTPDPEEHPKLFPITFVICVIWFAFISYVVTWMITIIGTTLGIPPAVQGLTVLAAGGSLPESVSLALLSRKGSTNCFIVKARWVYPTPLVPIP
ncbi:sodium/potassium/calcium exchanger 4-like isoform X2 [Cylas formicarius]|uniref:sodium/potassium/calcium exchanger 4-like isoform X2 n=1 Tax=Cylas formicarius TaxID=197179 RepID=UPI002958B318|nr:sodium/potassium/calcium exchanger 4-like isoform X2 [Cylas formicarius]